MSRKKADIEEVIQTFSSHVSESYPDPGMFRENLDKLLVAKKGKLAEEAYISSLERNIVFLHYLVFEARALLESILDGINETDDLDEKVEVMLSDLEEGVRKQVQQKIVDVFEKGLDSDFSGILAIRSEGGREYAERLEFEYKYLMTLRMRLFEFFGLLAAVNREYEIERVDEAAARHILNHVDFTVNYYLGNIRVGEIVGDSQEAGGDKASS